VVPIVIGAVVVVGAVLAWLLGSKDSKPAHEAAASKPAESAPSAPAGKAPAPGAPAAEVMKQEPPKAEVMQAPAPAATAPAPAQAPPPAAAPPPVTVDKGPRDPVVAIEPLPPTPNVSEEQAKAWAETVHAYFIEGVPPRQASELKAKLDATDIIDITPQFINALNGLNMSDGIDIRNAGKLVRYWHDREGEKMHFAFDMVAENTSQDDVNKRVIVIEEWRRLWKLKLDDPQKLQDFRMMVEERLQDRKTKAEADEAAAAAEEEKAAGGGGGG